MYIDLDETLVHSVYGKGRGVGKRTVIDAGSGDIYHSLLRPAAHFLLGAVRDMAEVSMLTTATREYALAHNQKFQLGFTEGEIVAREDYITKVNMAYSSEWVPSSTRVCPTAILIDNLSPRADAARLKMAYLGIRENQYLQIREFNGKDPENFGAELEQIISRLKTATAPVATPPLAAAHRDAPAKTSFLRQQPTRG